ncbi:MAG: LemA family protein [Candidatus Thermoplasmatota archaeon]|nr:LemA family protein [Candidatus Thermoplasmatota archaeon]
MSLSTGKTIGLIVLVVIIIVALVTTIWLIGTYNALVQENEQIESQWAQVHNEYQRKFDLIPQLVNVTDSYLNWEAGTLTNITALRTAWANALQSGDMDAISNASNSFDQLSTSIIVTVENYPGLDGIVVVSSLMYELSGTENRITVARMRYNEAVRDFNAHIKSFPANVVAGWGNFEERQYFQSSAAPPAP